MMIEAAILHGDESGGKIGRHLVQLQPFADNGAAMADLLAVHVQEGESQRPVDGIEIDGGVQTGRKQAQHQRHQIKRDQRKGDHRHGDGECRRKGTRELRGLAQLLGAEAVSPIGHGADC